jgi:hypothetical protein
MREKRKTDLTERRHYLGGSDARIIIGKNEKALVRLGREKRAETRPEDLSTNSLALVTEDLTGQWYKCNTGSHQEFPTSGKAPAVDCRQLLWPGGGTGDADCQSSRLLALTKPNPGATAVLINKFNSSRLECLL